MSRYRFRLETVLRVRRAEESDAKAALLRANARLRQALEVRDEAQRRYHDVVDGQGEAGTVEELLQHRWAAGLAADALALTQRGAMRAAGEAALAQVDWAQAARRVAVLERLDLRRRAEHAEGERRAERGAVDDLVTARYVADGHAARAASDPVASRFRPTPRAGRPAVAPGRPAHLPAGAPVLRLVPSAEGGETA